MDWTPPATATVLDGSPDQSWTPPSDAKVISEAAWEPPASARVVPPPDESWTPPKEAKLVAPASGWDRFTALLDVAREKLTPFLGPKDEPLPPGAAPRRYQQMDPDFGGSFTVQGNPSVVGQMSQPVVPLPRFSPNAADAKPTAIAKGVANTAAGFAEFAESPLGAISASLSGGGAGMARGIAGLYAIDMGTKVPAAAQAAGEASVNGTTQHKVEANLGLAANVALPGLLAVHAITGAKPAPGRPAEPLSVSEFGGEAPPEAAPLGVPPSGGSPAESAPATLAVQTSAPETAAPRATTVLANQTDFPVVEFPLKELKLSDEIKNFKSDADPDTGVVAGQQLEGKYERLGTGAITVYERANGQFEVISGRHRYDLAKRTGEETIPAQVVREQDGFTPAMALRLDAEVNIRDGQGSVADYGQFFRNSDISQPEAKANGLLSRAKGQAGWALGKQATDDLWALYKADKVKEPQAVAIAQAAPGEEALQRVGAKAAIDGAAPQELRNFIQAVRLKTRGQSLAQLDLFGADDTAMNEAQALAKQATAFQKQLDKEIKATDNAARNAEGAKARGIKFDRDPGDILKENALLRFERNQWDNWALHPEKVAKVLEASGVKLEESAKANLSPGLETLKGDEKVNWKTNGAGVLDLEEFRRQARSPESDVSPNQLALLDHLSKSGPNPDIVLNPNSSHETGYQGKYIYSEARPKDPGTVLLVKGARAKTGEVKEIGIKTAVRVLNHELVHAKITNRINSASGEVQQQLNRLFQTVKQSATESGFHHNGLKDTSEFVAEALSSSQFRGFLKSIAYSPKFEEAYWRESPVNQAKARIRNAFNGFVEIVQRVLKIPTDQWTALEEAIDVATQLERTPRVSVGSLQLSPATPRVTQTLLEKLDSLKADTSGRLLEGVTGLPIVVWNAAIDTIKLAVRAGGTLADGIERAIEWVKKNHPTYSFSEQEFRDAVNRTYGLREFGAKLQADPDVSPEAKAQVSAYVYEKRTNESDVEAAHRLIQEQGLERAVERFKNEDNQMPGAVRSALGKVLIKQLGTAELAARGTGDTAAADRLLNTQVTLINADLERSTDVAQALQAMSVYGDISPAGMLQHARKLMGDAGERTLRTLRPITESIRKQFDQANRTAVAGTIADPSVNTAARAAVNDAIADSPETKRAIVVELAPAFAASPEILRQARETIRAKLPEILKREPTPGLAVRSKAELAGILDDLAKRAASIAAGHYQGADLGKTLAEKLQERLGLDEATSKRLANSLDQQFGRMVKAAQDKLPQRIAAQRAKQAAPFDPNEFIQSALDREIRKQLHDRNIELGNLVKQHADTVDATGRSIGERVVTDAGLTGPRADALRAAFDKRFQELAAAEKRKAIKQMTAAGVEVPPQVNRAIGDLIKATNLGAFDDAAFYEALKKRLNLPTLTPELAKEITRRANALQQLPEGFQRDRASVQLLNYIATQGPKSIWDLPAAFWYANVLSHLTTAPHILIDNLGQLVGNTFIALLRNPRSATEIPGALARGAVTGLQHGREIMRTGVVTGIKEQLHTQHGFELNPITGGLSFLNNLKYVGRVLSAAHVSTFAPVRELRESIIARNVAIKEGLSGEARRQRVADILGNTEARVTAAQAQAAAEGLTGLDARRRTTEILQQSREAAVPGISEASRQHALRSTYLQDPYGIFGLAAQIISGGFTKLSEKSPGLALLGKLGAAPFLRIAGNILDEKMNWSPAGIYRAYWGAKTGEMYGRPLTALERSEVGDLYAKGIAGTVALGTVAFVATISGSGPPSPSARKQLEATGWKPHSVKLGNVYVDYLRTPLALPLALAGNIQDAFRYGHLEESDAMTRFGYGLTATMETVLSQSYLDSMGRLLDAVRNNSPKSGGKGMEQWALRTVTPFAIPAAVQDIDRLFDPTKYDATDIQSLMKSQVPFVRRQNNPTLNVLGEPVLSPLWQRDFGKQNPDLLWRTLAEKQAWVPELPQDVIVGNRNGEKWEYHALTPDQRYNVIKQSGPLIRQELLIRLADIKALPTPAARALVHQITQEQRAQFLDIYKP